MAIKCPKCSATIDAAPDELGLITCPQCGARLRSKQPVKITVQGGTGSSSPSLPRIDPSLAAPADVDHVLARLDSSSPDQTVRPGTFVPRPAAAAAPVPGPGPALEQVLAEVRELRKTQQEMLALLRAIDARSGAAPDDDSDGPQPSPRRGSEGRLVLVIDDDAAARQEAAASLQQLATVKTAGDGNAAIATIAMEKPEAIVLELGLAGPMPGRDLVNMIKATMEWVDIPLVLYTKLNLGDETEARQLHGADAIVRKGPGAARTLASKVGQILARV